MKTNKTMKPMKLVFLALALAFAFTLTAFIPAVGRMDAQAKTTKISTAPTSQKAAVMKKTGTYAVTQKKTDPNGNGYLGFTAPAAGTYKITISNLKAIGSNRKFLGELHILKFDGRFLRDLKVKTEGGSTYFLRMASNNYDKKLPNYKNKSANYIKKRSATLKLKKGEKIYTMFRGHFDTGDNKYTYTITIKKTK